MPFGDMIINQTQQLKIMKQKTGHRKQSWYYFTKNIFADYATDKNFIIWAGDNFVDFTKKRVGHS